MSVPAITQPPGSTLTAGEFRDALHDALRTRSLKIVADYVDYVDNQGTPTEKHRFLEWAVKTLGAEAEKKGGANLPVVNIQIGVGGTVTATVQPAAELVEEVSAHVVNFSQAPTELLQSFSHVINSDLLEAE